MSVWDVYRSRSTNRETTLRNEYRFLRTKLPDSLSYHKAVINGEDRKLAIINSDDFNIKTLCSLPGEDLPHGGLVYWMGAYWLITEKDVNNEVYTKCKMQQCNYLLRWINDEGEIIERWSIIEDGTKYLTGEWGDNEFIMQRGDTRIVMIVAKDIETARLDRENRFLIDDYDSPSVLAYRLTKPFKLGSGFMDNGVYKFILAECNTEDDDNLELHIADYYKYFPRDDEQQYSQPESDSDASEENGKRKVWI